MKDITFSCACGSVQGCISGVSPNLGTRIVCCCADCQAFAHFLQQGDRVLDSHGGTDIFQMPISYLTISKGIDSVKCVRLSAKGMHRWYAACCNTPSGNTLCPSAPFIGLVHSLMQLSSDREGAFGRVRAVLQANTQSQVSSSSTNDHVGSPLFAMLRTLRKLIVWKLRGLNRPSAFFTVEGAPICEPKVLQK